MNSMPRQYCIIAILALVFAVSASAQDINSLYEKTSKLDMRLSAVDNDLIFSPELSGSEKYETVLHTLKPQIAELQTVCNSIIEIYFKCGSMANHSSNAVNLSDKEFQKFRQDNSLLVNKLKYLSEELVRILYTSKRGVTSYSKTDQPGGVSLAFQLRDND